VSPVLRAAVLRAGEDPQAMDALVNRMQEFLTAMQQIQAGQAPAQQEQRDEHGRTAREARKSYLDFLKNKPTFERGRDRWPDFANRFNARRRDYQVTDEQAKSVLYDAITGQSSRLVIASMNPTGQLYAGMTFEQYLARMGEKFSPAAESLQMEAEYRMRKQGKHEDVQNYINAKYELFQLAFPNAGARNEAEFYRETTEGFLNKYVRDQMFSYEPANVEAFGARAVTMVQVERRRIKIGDSDTKSLDGLIPVTKPLNEGFRGEPMEVDAVWDDPTNGELDGECECMAMQEHGFRGPCFFCRKAGHMARSCPRKSAGLPKVADPSGREYNGAQPSYGAKLRGRPLMSSGPSAARGRGQGPQRGAGKTGGRPAYSSRQVNQCEDAEEEDAENYEDEEDAAGGEEDGAHFLGDRAL